MTKAELIKAIAAKHGYTNEATEEIITATFDEIVAQVSAGGRVDIAAFGTFENALRAARTARNPRTGEQVDVPEKLTPRFRPMKRFKDAVNES
jgi:nucleoid DNA-binding protein